MATDFADSTLTRVRELINRLQSPVPDLPTLLALLSSPLACIGLLPPQFLCYNVDPIPDGAISIPRHIPPLQRALLEHVVPTWEASLAEQNATLLIEQYFCPDVFSFTSSAAGDIALLAYSSVLSQQPTDYAIRLLVRLSTEYPIDRLHSTVFSGRNDASSKLSIDWEDCVRNIVMVPAKVANALGERGVIPPLLEHRTYFNNVCVRCESLISSLSVKASREMVSSTTFLLTKLVNVGVFPPTPPTSRSQPSFWEVTLSKIRARLDEENSFAYSAFWCEIMLGLPSTFTLQAILVSLLASLSEVSTATDTSYGRALVKRKARLLHSLVGPLSAGNQELWECVSAVILGREWIEGYSRMFVCWAAGSHKDQVDEQALEVLINRVLDMWSSPDHIKCSLLSRHRYLTTLLLVTVSYFPPSSNQIQSLAISPIFISGVGTYVGHLDNSVRRCGMLAAEVVAKLAGKKLDFGDWEGNDSGKSWAREIRQLIKARDVDADLQNITTMTVENMNEIYTPSVLQNSGATTLPSDAVSTSMVAGDDSDDSLTGYASLSSSRSTSPTPSELIEIEKDPTIGVGIKKIPRPVYLAQLGEMVRSTSGVKEIDANHEANKIEIALDCAEELIRRKHGYGTELDENAVNLVYGLVGLQNNYDLEGFEAKRQGAVNALVACCSRKAVPSLIEEFFKNQYSTNQRYVILNALALGARELASPASAIPRDHIAFPSKVLPSPAHQQYLAAGDQHTNPISSILDTISHEAVERDKDNSTHEPPELVRERRLRIRTPAKITEVTQSNATAGRFQETLSSTTFAEVAAEFFIAPLINRFWLFLRDEQTREERTTHHEGRQRYRGAGTGLLLNPIVLAHFLGTLAILVHASQNAPEWLAVVAPNALEIAVTLGTRPVSQMEEDAEVGGLDEPAMGRGETKGKEASVLTTALELALVVLDGCMELDGGRALSLDHTALLLGSGEWAGAVFGLLEKGVRVEGGGGAQEIRLRRAAAAVLLKVDDVTSRWRRSMVDIR